MADEPSVVDAAELRYCFSRTCGTEVNEPVEGKAIRSVNGFRLHPDRGVLERNGAPVPIRPKSFALLSYLLLNPGRVIGKEELIAVVWGRSAVTDDALTQTVKDVRRAIDDGGGHFLRAVPKRGYMLADDAGTVVAVAPSDFASDGPPGHVYAELVRESISSSPLTAPGDGTGQLGEGGVSRREMVARVSGRDRPAIAVLPFAIADMAPDWLPHLRNGLVRDIVRDLARLRTLFVIAANSIHALEGSSLDRMDAGRLLRCDYVCVGDISPDRDVLRFDVELIAIGDGHVLFSENFSRPLSAAAGIGAEIAGEIARLIAEEIDLFERRLAALRPPNALDAWQAYHRGLWHMHKFTDADNLLAADFFRLSIERDPAFARPYAGLSFTHWLRAYLLAPAEQALESMRAYDLAARAVSVDPHDPAAHCAFGRALWMRGAVDEAVEALDRATRLSPNYAFGHYARGFVEALSGSAAIGIEASDRARELSPFDPFMAPMQASRAIGMMRLGQFEDAAAWGARAARQPNAHAHVLRVAALSLTAAGRHEEAASLVRRVNFDSPDNGGDAFIRANRLRPPDEKLFRELTRQSGLL